MIVHIVHIRDTSDGASWIDSVFSERYFAEMEVGLLRPIYGVHYQLEIKEMEVINACPVRIEQEHL